MILKGFILSTSQGGRKARVKTIENEIITNVLLLHPYGETSNIQSDDSSQVLLLFPMNSKTNVVGIPYNVLLQPELELMEKAVGNFKKGNKITFKKNGENDVSGKTNFDKEVTTAQHYVVGNKRVVGSRKAAIPAPTGGVTIDAEARTAIAAIIAAMKATGGHGLIED